MAEPYTLTDRAATEAEPRYVGWDANGAAFAPPDEPGGPVLGPARMAAAMATAGAPWWPGADNTIQRAPLDGGSMVDGYAPRGVGHTTETATWPGYATNFHPHVTGHLTGGRFAARGHIRHDRAARALRNLAGGVQTNRGGARQLELVAFTDRVELEGLPAALADGIGRYAAWLEAEWGVRREFRVQVRPYPASYGLDNGVRLSAAAWAAYDAWLTHQHVPENSHGDTGALDWSEILGAGGDDMGTVDGFSAEGGAALKRLLRETLNEGTAAGQLSWADTERAILKTVQLLVNEGRSQTSQIIATIGDVPAAVQGYLAAHPLTAELPVEAQQRIVAGVVELLRAEGLPVDPAPILDALAVRVAA